LLAVLEQRYVANAVSTAVGPEELWTDVFCAEVGGKSTREYIADSTLPRPRDLVVMANAAVACAIDRGHETVQEEDVLTARERYSVYAYEALLVENGVTIPELRRALPAFLGGSAILTWEQARDMIERQEFVPERADAVLEKLVSSSFLGLEVHADDFVYPEVGTQTERAVAQAARVCPVRAERRLKIHGAFHPYLEVGPFARR